MVDFGQKPNDLAYEVISKEADGKSEVLSALCIGRAKKWDKERINSYLIEMIYRE